MSTRHSWVKLKVHNYLCKKCGTGKRNEQHESGEWFATFHRPDGSAIVASIVPACEVGPLTKERLDWLASKSNRRSAE